MCECVCGVYCINVSQNASVGDTVANRIEESLSELLWDVLVRSEMQQRQLWALFRSLSRRWCHRRWFIKAWGIACEALTKTMIATLYTQSHTPHTQQMIALKWVHINPRTQPIHDQRLVINNHTITHTHTHTQHTHTYTQSLLHFIHNHKHIHNK